MNILQEKMIQQAEMVIMDQLPEGKRYNRLEMPREGFVEQMEWLISHLPEDKPLPEPFVTYKQIKFNSMVRPVTGRMDFFQLKEAQKDYEKITF